VLLTYTVSDLGSLEYLDSLYDSIPKLPRYRNTVVRSKAHQAHPEESEVRVLYLEGLRRKRSIELPGYVVREDYPVVIAGCKAPGQARQVHDSDVQKFLKDHPSCTFGGEFELDNQQEIGKNFSTGSRSQPLTNSRQRVCSPCWRHSHTEGASDDHTT